MSDTKFTPGPWEWDCYSSICTKAPHGHPFQRFDKCDSINVAHINGPADFHGDMVGAVSEEATANAHLIATAPELYEACKRVLYYLEKQDLGRCYHAKLRKALAKARGGEAGDE